MPEPLLVVIGISGAGRRVIDIALDMMDHHPDAPFRRVVALDDDPSELNLGRLREQGVEYLGSCSSWLRSAEPAYFSVGIGDTGVRQRIADLFTSHEHTPATLAAPTARISRHARVSTGCVVSPGADLSTNVQLGKFTHVMANAAISHDARIGAYVNINPGVVVAGECTVGDHATVGAGAVVLQGRSVGRRSIVGAAACVTRDVPTAAVVKGVPAR